jgi:zinc/manganese transport system substrate-binding protein
MQAAKSRSKFLIPATVIILILVVGAAAGIYFATRSTSSSTTSSSISSSTSSSSSASTSNTVIQVVAAENFWGSLVSQLGGIHVNVTSIVSDPNTDPHEYESNPANAIAVTNAKFIIVNGAGYDTWALDILSAENTQNQVVLNVQELINQTMEANPHFWYNPYYVNDTVAAMYKDLVKIDPTDTSYYHAQYAVLNASLWQSYMSQEQYIRENYGGTTTLAPDGSDDSCTGRCTPVASTESIFVYMANATGLEVVSPAAFMAAVAEGNDPPAASVAQFENLLQGGNTSVRVLVYNEQTVTPLTQTIKAEAAQYQVPIIGVTETIQPVNFTFQAWMQSEVGNLLNALNAAELGQ